MSDKRLQEQIDQNLKRVFQDTVEEELPDRFRQLLDQLKTQGAQAEQPDSDEGESK